MISKVFALSPDAIQTAYGIQTSYGMKIVPSSIEKAFSIGKFILPIILFVIGLVVIISKKITKKVKIIIISSLNMQKKHAIFLQISTANAPNNNLHFKI